MFLINDATDPDLLFKFKAQGVVCGRGAEPPSLYPESVALCAPPSEIELIPRSEWQARIQEREAQQSSLKFVRLRGNNGVVIPSLNQGSVGYCWSHSTAHCVILDRAKANQPYIPLSAYAVASIIKNGRDEGGWCGLSQQFLRETGIPSQQFWPQGNRSLSLNTPEMKANAALHKVTEEWVDLTRQVYDQNLTEDMIVTCLLNNIPVALDFSWWGHSVCGIDVQWVDGEVAYLIWNSWGDTWGDQGMGLIQGTKKRSMGAVAVRSSGAAEV